MLKALRVLLAAALALPAPASAAGSVRASVETPAGVKVQAPALPAIPSLPGAAIPTGAQLSVPAQVSRVAPVPAAAAAAANAAQPAQAQPQTALQHLQAEVPFQAPQAGDVDGAKSFADKAFDFKLGAANADGDGAVVPEARKSGGGGGGGSSSPPGGADDGGGPGYPSRQVRFRGKLFRSVLFRPNTPVEAEIIRAIDAAQKSVHLALYEFKLSGVLDALRRAKERGVEIHIVLDYSNAFPTQEPGSDYRPKRSKEIWALLREGFDVKILRGMSDFGINHNKFAVIDHGEAQQLAIFGSFNWSWTAENSHYENANFDTDKERIEILKKYWDWMAPMAVPENQARDHAWPQSRPAPPISIAESIDFNGVKLPPVVLSPDSTPGKSIEDRLVQAIDAAKSTIDVGIFALRSTRIAEALARAHNDKSRKVRVRVIMDRGQSESGPFGPYAQWLAAQGVEVRTLAGPDDNSSFPLAQKTHHKFAIFDGKLVETGSANYTKYAGIANFENAHFLDDVRDAQAYAWVYERMWNRALRFPAPQTAPTLPTDAELAAEAAKPTPPPPPIPAHPAPDPSVKPRDVAFRGKVFPSYAFRPDTPIQPLVVQAIDAAQKSVRIALYEFNLDDVMDALRRAKKRKLKVEIVVDRSHVYTTGKDSHGNQRKPSPEILALINEGFDILTLKGEKGGIMHNKYFVLDAETKDALVMFGSYNFADTAEHHHYENVKFSNDKDDVAAYLAYFDYKRGLAAPIDHDKLDEVLNRGLDADDEDEAGPERMAGDARDSKHPEPPPSPGRTIDFNGETFRRHYFSPQGGILDAWVRAINAAEKSVEIAMFGFYSREVAEALVNKLVAAKKAGAEFKATVVLDAGQGTLAKIDDMPVSQWLAERGVDVRMRAGPNDDGDPMYEKQHNKFMILDGKLLFTGSFNLSPTAENYSFENENVIDDVADVRGYVEFFMRMFGLGWPPRKPSV